MVPAYKSVELRAILPSELVIPELVIGERTSRTLTLRVGIGHKPFALRRIENPLPEILKSIKAIPLNAKGSIARTTKPDNEHAEQDLYEIALDFQAPRTGIFNKVFLEIIGEGDIALKVPLSINVVSRVRLMPSVLYLPRQSEKGPLFQATCFCRVPSSETVEVMPSGLPKGFHVKCVSSSLSSGYAMIVVSCQADSLPSAGKHILEFDVRHGQGVEQVELPVIIKAHEQAQE
ncbi:MAG: hypothetical protein L0Y72_13625 [Gemmataceae bacterium]|nr:hypothetical protein [Gemmataceae bacterium]MCI0740080.1 hypothetical protein [Gemmataceae bacterium]